MADDEGDEGMVIGRIIIERRLYQRDGDESDLVYAWSETGRDSGEGIPVIEALGMMELARGIILREYEEGE